MCHFLYYSFSWKADTYVKRFSGCQVFAYDHTISAPTERGKNIKFFQTGLGIGEHLETLRNLIYQNHHETSTIDYLKVNWELLKNHWLKLIYIIWSDWYRGLWIQRGRIQRLDQLRSSGECQSDCPGTSYSRPSWW